MKIQGRSDNIKNGTRDNLLFVGLTLALVGYLMIWLAGPSAGLQFIGVELGEWREFLGVGSGRNWCYLPPIGMGLVIALMTFGWSNRYPGTWIARGLAIAVAMLSFPAIASIQLEPASEWVGRVAAIGIVVVVAASIGVFTGRREASIWLWAVIAGVSLTGVIIPTAQFMAIRPIVEVALRQPVGIGSGVWLNAMGLLIIALVALATLAGTTQTKRTAAEQAAVLKE